MTSAEQSRDPVICSLYVPGDRPDRFAKALSTAADLVVIDLEDSVGIGSKEVARQHIRQLWATRPPLDRLSIRINSGPGRAADLALLEQLAELGGAPAEVRVPKVESPADLAGLTGFRVHALIESARGVQALPEIADHVLVIAVGLGEADLGGELGLGDEGAFAYSRSRLVVAAAAAGLRPPAMSVYPRIKDLAGLAASCRIGRNLGLSGRSAVHPTQIPVIIEGFAPTDAEIESAQAVLAALEVAGSQGRGVATTAEGDMVDAAMRSRARWIVDRSLRRG